jgi:hypothetical protein
MPDNADDDDYPEGYPNLEGSDTDNNDFALYEQMGFNTNSSTPSPETEMASQHLSSEERDIPDYTAPRSGPPGIMEIRLREARELEAAEREVRMRDYAVDTSQQALEAIAIQSQRLRYVRPSASGTLPLSEQIPATAAGPKLVQIGEVHAPCLSTLGSLRNSDDDEGIPSILGRGRRSSEAQRQAEALATNAHEAGERDGGSDQTSGASLPRDAAAHTSGERSATGAAPESTTVEEEALRLPILSETVRGTPIIVEEERTRSTTGRIGDQVVSLREVELGAAQGEQARRESQGRGISNRERLKISERPLGKAREDESGTANTGAQDGNSQRKNVASVYSNPSESFREFLNHVAPVGSSIASSSQSPRPDHFENQPRGTVDAIVLPRWQPDAEVTYCPICRTQFSFFVRKHHCRYVLCRFGRFA